MKSRDWLLAGVLCGLLCSLLIGCAPRPPAPAPADPPIVLAPPAPLSPALAPPGLSARLKRDTAAVQAHARQYVARPSTPPYAVSALEPLTREMGRALAVMELRGQRGGGYRRADVARARAAADAVARFLDAQAPAPPAAPAPDPAAGEQAGP